jgi:outer membrane lipoprotein SlyB
MNGGRISYSLSGALVAAAVAFAPAAFAACTDCGTVTDVRYMKKEGEGSGAGLIAGGIIGGVLGHQVGGGRGKDVATVAGAAGGAYAGHQIEKNAKSTNYWRVDVKMDDGSSRYWTFGTQPSWHPGDKVKIVDKKLVNQ